MTRVPERAGILLLAHGAPERLEDVERYLSFVRSGRPASPEILEEVRHRYAAIGGSSPLLGWTRTQAEALERLLGMPVFFGMRNWHPFIRETMEQVRESGLDRLAAVCLAPQFSELSVGLYIKRTEEAKREAGVTAVISWAKSFHDEPLLIEAFAERFRALGATGEPLGESVASRRVLFTAHSLPERALANGDPYDPESRATAAAVAARVGLTDFDFAYQSQGMTGDRWLGPTVESCLERYAAQGVREVVVDPIGFVCDHVEVLYDIDILFRDYAAERGITLRRPESLNGSPKFTAALADVAKRCL
ncbi:MAG TPA: ferrochelatase [Bryobacteraceae bacterium]|jgi:ferrochelatase|nr:ferrochelatase [Bryobacteraceae bacterium]